MSRVPAMPFCVIVQRKPMPGAAMPPVERHNYATMAGAISYRDTALRKRNTHKVTVTMILDETTPSADQTEPERNIRSSHHGEKAKA